MACFCLTPQGERGRDGTDGRKGDPVSPLLTVASYQQSTEFVFILMLCCMYVCVCVCFRVVMACLGGKAPEALKVAQVLQVKPSPLTPQWGGKEKRERGWVQLRLFKSLTNFLVRKTVTRSLFPDQGFPGIDGSPGLPGRPGSSGSGGLPVSKYHVG